MRLVSLKIQGFKSFAKTTVLRFSDALTAIVGPNGCGKSNLVDAFRWVLGEPNARALRGEKMQDVIFAGSEKQKPMQFAEVTVTLADVQGILPVAYDELSITRRVYRSGDSEFRLNDQPVRLKDIQALLWDSGLGRQAFSVFEQGRVDQLLQASPAERRGIFEEIAGISRFKERRKETLRKLEENHTHLERLQDIHKEVAQQVSVLERQAAAARKFREQKDRADRLERGIFHYRYQTVLHKKLNLERQGAQLQDQLQGGSELQQQQQQELIQSQERVRQAQAAWDAERLAQHQAEQKLEGLRASLRMLQRQREEGHQRQLRLKTDQERIEVRIEQWAQELTDLQGMEVSIQEGDSAQHQLLKMVQESYREAQEHEQALRQQLETCWQEERQAVQLLQQLSVEVERQHTETQRLQDRASQLQQRIAQQAEEREALRHQHREREKQLQETRAQVAAAKAALEACDREWTQLRQASEACVQEWQRLTSEQTSLQSQHQLVQQWVEEGQSLGQGAQALLQEAQRKGSPLHGKVSRLLDHVEVHPGTERLLASALGRANAALLCRDEEALRAAFAFARTQQLTDLVLYAPGAGELSDSCDALLGGQPLLAPLLQGLDLVESTRLLAASGWVATLDGWVRTPAGLVWCGAGSSGDPLLHQARLQALTLQLTVVNEQMGASEERLRLARHAEAEAEQRRQQADREVRRLDIRYVEGTMAEQQLRMRLEQMAQQEISFQQELGSLVSQREQRQKSVEQHRSQAAQQQELVQALGIKRESVQAAAEHGRAQLQAAQGQWHRIEQESQQGRLEQAQRLNRQQLLRVQQEESRQQIVMLGQRVQDEEQASQRAEKDAAATLEEMEKLQHQLVVVQQQAKEVARQLEQLREQAHQAEQVLVHGGQQLRQAQTQRQQIEQQTAALHETLTQLAHDYTQRFFEPLAEISGEVALQEGINHAEKEVRELRQQLEQAKDIHLGSIEELERVGERHRFLAQQLHDVTESEKQLQEELQSLEVASRKLFKDSFEEIRGHFQRNFSLLFEGGTADLKLTDGGDLLEAGIEIFAQPPGKHTKILQLLSGGERSLTAMALLFAMFETKPAPFCLLDEMDAALDDANVERFLRLLERYMQSTQFLLITHNKRTMAAADLLLGVSMQEKGVSTVLALDFAEAEPQLEMLDTVGV